MDLLTAPCLCITFRQFNSVLQELQVEETRVAQTILAEKLQDVIARSLPHLRFLAITVGPYFTFYDEIYTKLPERLSWWRIRRPEGGIPVAQPMSHWVGERLLDRLHNMTYDALVKLKPEEIGID